MLPLLLFALFVAPVQEETPSQVITSTILPLPQLATSAWNDLTPTRSLELSLVLADHDFLVQQGDPPRVATRYMGKSRQHLRHAARARFQWPDGEEWSGLELLFEHHGEDWNYGNAETRRFDLGPVTIYLIDVDLDGKYTLQEDAWSLAPGGPVQRLAPDLILGADVFHVSRLERDGTELQATRSRINGSPTQLEFLHALNLLRAEQGLPAVQVDGELSVGCTAHGNYLWLNRDQLDLDLNEEDSRLPGESRAGRSTARRSLNFRGPALQALQSMWDSPTGRWALTDPLLIEIGLSSCEQPVTVLDLQSRSTHTKTMSRRWRRFLPSPAAGSHNQSVHSEVQVNGRTQLYGPPILLRMDLQRGDLESYKLELFRLTGNSRSPLKTLPLESEHREQGLLGGIPKRALSRGTSYLAVHQLLVDGEELRVEAQFRTQE
ncbi:MAG: hypothetical protein ACI9F9_000984 [Candidatus Paceibacteria bacterium]|jgi:hypothetical protein